MACQRKNGAPGGRTAAPIRSRTTPTTSSWSAPAARACARPSAAARPGLQAPRASPRCFPTRSHTVAAQGGIAAALGNMGEDDWRWHMYDTVKGADWLGDQDAIEYHVPQRAGRGLRARALGPAVLAPRGRRQDLPAPVRRHDHALRQGHRAAHLRRRRPHRPRHAAHACTARRCGTQAEFFIEYFAIDLIMDDDGRCRGVVALKLDDGTIHRFRAHMTILATGGYGRAYFSCTSRAHLHRRRQRHGAARRAAAAGHGVRAVPSDRHLRRRLPDHRRRRAAKAAISPTPRASASWSATRRPPRTSPRATSSRAR